MNTPLRHQLDAHLSASKISQEAAAKAMGISGPTLSDWRKEKYKGDNIRIEALVADYLGRRETSEREVEAIKRDFDFVPTSIYNLIRIGAELAEARGEIRPVLGDSGVGKTTALLRLRADKPSAILVQVYRGIRKNRFLHKLALAAGINNPRGSFDDLFELLVDTLQGTGRLIMVDEAEHLPLDAVDALRRLNDFTGCGLVLAGLPVWYAQLRNQQRQYAYLYNRTAIPINLPHLKKEDTARLVATIVTSSLPAEVWHEASNGIGRDLKIIALEGLRVAALNNIDPTDVGAFAGVVRQVKKDLGRLNH